MRKLIIICLFVPFFLDAQSGFNRTYSLDSLKVAFSGVVASDDSLVVYGSIYNNTDSKWELVVLKMDTLGDEGNRLIKKNAGIGGFNTLETKMIKTSDGGVLISGNVGYSTESFTLKLNPNLGEEFYIQSIDSINRVVFHREAIEVSDGYIIGGDVQKQDYSDQLWASKLDYEGNVLWYREYGAPTDTLEWAFDMAVTPEGNAMIAGIQLTPISGGNGYQYDGWPLLLTIDQ